MNEFRGLIIDLREFLAETGSSAAIVHNAASGLCQVTSAGQGLEVVIPARLYDDGGALISDEDRAALVAKLVEIVDDHNTEI